MNNYRKYFNEGINADDYFGLLKAGQWINASNVRVFTTNTGATAQVEEIGGTVLLANMPALPTGTNYCIGGVSDNSNNRFFFFNWNSTGENGIYCYDKKNAIGYKVLLSSQVTGGLNFSKDYFIHSPDYIDNKLYWTDNLNEPKKINTEAGIKLNQSGYTTTFAPYTSPIEADVIKLIKKPFNLPVSVTKTIQISPALNNNLLSTFTGKFASYLSFTDYENSVLSEYSLLVQYNSLADTVLGYNAVDISFPLTEVFQQDVQKVNLCVRIEGANTFSIIKIWDRSITADAAAITSHNSGGTALTYRFYNDQNGLALDQVFANKPFESVPITSGAQEIAKDRLFLANNKQGYNVPTLTSLIAFPYIDNGAALTATWFYILYNGGSNIHWYVDLGSLGMFDVAQPASSSSVPPPQPTYPGTVAYGSLTFRAAGPGNMVSYILANFSGWVGGLQYPGNTSTVTGGPAVPGLDGKRVFKSNASYRIAIQFYDKPSRKWGVVENGKTYQTSDRDYSTVAYTTLFNWSLDNTNALTEIPIEATHYSIVITKCLRTPYFLQAKAANLTYATKDAAGLYLFNTNTYSSTLNGVAIDISLLDNFGMGYTYTDGDVIKVYKTGGGVFFLKIVAQSGKWLVTELKDLGTIGNTATPYLTSIFEVYTPYKQSINELYYEVGNMYPITSAGTSGRAYSSLAGSIPGDTILMDRATATYTTENMAPLDAFYKYWYTHHGRACAKDTIGQKQLTNNICFSDVLLAGTKINGLSSFQPLNVYDKISADAGTIMKLQLASKIQIDGTVLLTICQDQTISCYLGEQELLDTQGSAYVASSNSVIGSSKTLQGGMGTRHPESVVDYNGLVWFFDVKNGTWVQYANNGLFPISNNKLVRASNLFAKKINSLTRAQVEALGSRPNVIGGYDPYHNEVLFTIPTVEATAPKGMLVDYAINYPYDIYDGQGKTLIYKNLHDMWIGSISFQPEMMLNMGNDLFSFSGGKPYINNQSNSCNFFGVQYTAKLMYANNPGAIHRFMSIGLECNKKPLFVHLRTEDPNVQSSDLVTTSPTVSDFVTKEGVQYATLLRDRLSPNTAGSYIQKQMSGDRMKGKALLVMLEFEFVNDPSNLQLRFSDISNVVSKGHLLTNGNS